MIKLWVPLRDLYGKKPQRVKDWSKFYLHNHIWELVAVLPRCKPLGAKWTFKRKIKLDDSSDNYKVRLKVK